MTLEANLYQQESKINNDGRVRRQMNLRDIQTVYVSLPIVGDCIYLMDAEAFLSSFRHAAENQLNVKHL